MCDVCCKLATRIFVTSILVRGISVISIFACISTIRTVIARYIVIFKTSNILMKLYFSSVHFHQGQKQIILFHYTSCHKYIIFMMKKTIYFHTEHVKIHVYVYLLWLQISTGTKLHLLIHYIWIRTIANTPHTQIHVLLVGTKNSICFLRHLEVGMNKRKKKKQSGGKWWKYSYFKYCFSNKNR